jgi:hypothetical protein
MCGLNTTHKHWGRSKLILSNTRLAFLLQPAPDAMFLSRLYNQWKINNTVNMGSTKDRMGSWPLALSYLIAEQLVRTHHPRKWIPVFHCRLQKEVPLPTISHGAATSVLQDGAGRRPATNCPSGWRSRETTGDELPERMRIYHPGIWAVGLSYLSLHHNLTACWEVFHKPSITLF